MDLINSSWYDKIIWSSLIVLFTILGIDYKFGILPFHGVLLYLYLLLIFICTIWATFILLQNLLKNNKPLELDFEKNVYFAFFKRTYAIINNQAVCDKTSDNIDGAVCRQVTADTKSTQVKGIDDRIDDLIGDIEKRFVTKWYQHISADHTFTEETKLLLDDIVRRFLQVVIEIDSKQLVHGILTILLKHVKEFRKTKKRIEKSGGTIEECYRYSHVGSKSQKALEHFIHRLTTNVLCQFIIWDLWNSLPCRTLISILARKFFTLILVYISAPGFINYKILQACSSTSTKAKLKLDEFSFISLADVDLSGKPSLPAKEKPAEKTSKLLNTQDIHSTDSATPKMSPKKPLNKFPVPAKKNDVPSPEKRKDERIDEISVAEMDKELPGLVEVEEIGSSVVTKSLVNRPKRSEPVKIYESKSAHKTWRNSSDLECISLGQDLLALQDISDPDSQIQDLIEKKLWKDNADLVEDEKAHSLWDNQDSWNDEESANSSPTSNLHSYLKSTTSAASIITNTIRPIGNVTATTLHNMKELQQTTVNTMNNVVKPVSQATSTAIHKIGDLQDEAAGVVEGILDFGMAGLRKGLRLTGLQENFSELTHRAKMELHKTDTNKTQKTATHTKEAEKATQIQEMQEIGHSRNPGKLSKTSHIILEDTVDCSSADESVWVNPLNKDTPSFDGNILLERTPDTQPEEIVPRSVENLDSFKARKKSIPLIAEEVFVGNDSPDPEYEENTDLATTIAKLRSLLQQKSSESGFTTPSLSPMPQDDANKPTTPSDSNQQDLTKVDGAMPSLYKFCARTATGVFQNTLNTIKTALPGNVNECDRPCPQDSIDSWTFIEADATVNDFQSHLQKLLQERQVYCSVDPACEAFDSLEIVNSVEGSWKSDNQPYDDELDEFDVRIPITKAVVDIVCELVADTNTSFVQEPVVKAVLLLTGASSEDCIDKLSEKMLCNVNKLVGNLPESGDQHVLSMKLEEMVRSCLEILPASAKEILGVSTIEAALRLFVESFQSQRINQDVFMQIFELFSSLLIYAGSQLSPTYSA